MRLWKWIRRDGLLHIETCAFIAVVFGLFLPWWASGLVALAAGIGKEIWDIEHGVANWHDLLCDLAGVVLGTLIAFF